jgi:lysophospholipase L1-like esterase
MIPKRICVIGGSTVHGQGDPEEGGFVARLRSWHESANPEQHRVFNLGIGGDALKEMLCRGRRECLARRPDLILLYPGLNDTRRLERIDAPLQTSFEDVREQLSKLIEQLRDVAPLVVMSAVPIDESRTSPFRGNWFFRMNDALEMVKTVSAAAITAEIPYIPLFESFEKRDDLHQLLADGLHCNGGGHQIIFQKVQEFLMERGVGDLTGNSTV